MTTQALWTTASGKTACDVSFDHGGIEVDLDAEAGGGPHPSAHDLLDGALAACTALTLELYVKRKGYDIQVLRVEVTHGKTEAGFTMTRTIHVTGNLDEEQQASILRIANACPVHKTLVGDITINTATALNAA
ncbi:OsmC family protein [Uliginosibacterium sp. H1]|uniref:OsmC family protein n=1 Tax=Uliginosibacterium sp. H1 TaxID=3114757 RepID=UPI002E17922B|nr:OsmC family protein [Uliginosibacterium sp. H1]